MNPAWIACLDAGDSVKKLIRRLRGLLGVGLTWGAAWAAIGAAVGFVIGVVRPEAWTLTNPVLEWAIGIGLYGFVSGFGFGSILSFMEGSRTIRDLILSRVALWGVLGSAAVPLLFGLFGMFDPGTAIAEVIGAMGVTSVLGGIFAPGSVVIARRGELPSGTTETLSRIESGE